jgi:organic hydroperoxide reductase OsmC/OhrA
MARATSPHTGIPERPTPAARDRIDRTPRTVEDRVVEASLVVLPRPRGDGLQAWVRGRFVELADPARGDAFTPTPNDLLVSAIASSLAWSARAFLARHALNDNVTVSARWSTQGFSLGDLDVNLRVTVVNLSEVERDALQAQLEAAVPSHHARRQIHLVLDPDRTAMRRPPETQ